MKLTAGATGQRVGVVEVVTEGDAPRAVICAERSPRFAEGEDG
jgi:hypothetical protein